MIIKKKTPGLSTWRFCLFPRPRYIPQGKNNSKTLDEFTAFITPGELEETLTKMDFVVSSNTMNALQQQYAGLNWSKLRDFQKATDEGKTVLMLINMNMLDNDSKGNPSIMSNHYVYYAGNLVIDTANNTATFDIGTWGSRNRVALTTTQFFLNFYGSMIVNDSKDRR